MSKYQRKLRVMYLERLLIKCGYVEEGATRRSRYNNFKKGQRKIHFSKNNIEILVESPKFGYLKVRSEPLSKMTIRELKSILALYESRGYYA